MKKYILTFVISFTIFAVVSAPANILQNEFDDFIFSGKLINGEVWHEKYGIIKWDLRPMRLLAGELAFAVNINKKNNNLSTIFSINLFNNKKVRNTKGIITSDYVRMFIYDLPEFIAANIVVNKLDIDIDELVRKIPEDVNANIMIKEVMVMGEQIGDYSINIVVNDKILDANIFSVENSSFLGEITANTDGDNIVIKGDVIGSNESNNNLLEAIGLNNQINHTIDSNTLQF